MAIYLYLRVSTQAQHFTQQMQDINDYFASHNISKSEIADVIEEKESGGTSYTDRKLQQLLNRCKAGDTIYAASTDRLGRNFVDMIRMMEMAKNRGIIIVACKQGLSLADDTIATKIILSVTTIIDEDERMRIRHRAKNGVKAAMDELNRTGQRITKRGTVQTHWGNEKGCNLDKAREASIIAKQDRMIQWREQSVAVKTALRKRAEGWTLQRIVDEIGQLYDDNAPSDPNIPNPYATPNGCKPTKGSISRWLRDANQLTLVG